MEDKTKGQIIKEIAERDGHAVIDLPVSPLVGLDFNEVEKRSFFFIDEFGGYPKIDFTRGWYGYVDIPDIVREPKERDDLPYSKPEVVPYQKDMKNRAKILRKRQLTKQNRKRR